MRRDRDAEGVETVKQKHVLTGTLPTFLKKFTETGRDVMTDWLAGCDLPAFSEDDSYLRST
jgi:hypothetical protein